jgi:hypothetical protein
MNGETKMTIRSSVHVVLAAIAFAIVAVQVTDAAITFTATFKSPDAGTESFAGKKVAAVVISDDDSLRVAGEESLVRELSARGMVAVSSHRIVPKEELRRAETARPWFERAKVEGMVVVRPILTDSRQTYTPATWVNVNYGTLWGYYGYGWGAVYVPGSSRRETTVVVETTVYSVARDRLLWAAVSETRNPRDLPSFVEELVKESVKEMQKQGLAASRPRYSAAI